MGSFADEAKRAGFRVSEKTVKYTDLTGESVEERRVTAYHPNRSAKMSYSELNGRGTFSITLSGDMANRSMADRIESLGGNVDLDEGKRLYAVFRDVTRRRAGDIVRTLFGSRNARLARTGKREAGGG